MTSEPVSRIEFERAVHFSTQPVQFLWITSTSPDETISRIRSLDSVVGALPYGSVENSSLVRVEWSPDFHTDFVRLLSERGIVVVEAVGEHRSWSLRLRGPDDGSLRRLYDDCTSSHIQFEIEQLHTVPGPMRGCAMTDKQLEAVTAAFEEGFFDVPRRTTLGELSDRFDISEQALSKLIRRGVRSVLSEHLSAGAE
ncbi:Transcriptional regulator, contains HTH domain [Natranaeroarchaeum sulfidigenes]|uniref:Transcriptional regulator, contains HTH domain n=1 Tax=Natranaeroarchaeum sulfidigenes TaxID=2784880 RepID=A0A897MTR4_9EURY|nr:Transcriptional regulator, contains HTH domain [Natranaeroarchaeum sulfidigenes]